MGHAGYVSRDTHASLRPVPRGLRTREGDPLSSDDRWAHPWTLYESSPHAAQLGNELKADLAPRCPQTVTKWRQSSFTDAQAAFDAAWQVFL